jgi:hypothetical protein
MYISIGLTAFGILVAIVLVSQICRTQLTLRRGTSSARTQEKMNSSLKVHPISLNSVMPTLTSSKWIVSRAGLLLIEQIYALMSIMMVNVILLWLVISITRAEWT